MKQFVVKFTHKFDYMEMKVSDVASREEAVQFAVQTIEKEKDLKRQNGEDFDDWRFDSAKELPN